MPTNEYVVAAPREQTFGNTLSRNVQAPSSNTPSPDEDEVPGSTSLERLEQYFYDLKHNTQRHIGPNSTITSSDLCSFKSASSPPDTTPTEGEGGKHKTIISTSPDAQADPLASSTNSNVKAKTTLRHQSSASKPLKVPRRSHSASPNNEQRNAGSSSLYISSTQATTGNTSIPNTLDPNTVLIVPTPTTKAGLHDDIPVYTVTVILTIVWFCLDPITNMIYHNRKNSGEEGATIKGKLRRYDQIKNVELEIRGTTELLGQGIPAVIVVLVGVLFWRWLKRTGRAGSH